MNTAEHLSFGTTSRLHRPQVFNHIPSSATEDVSLTLRPSWQYQTVVPVNGSISAKSMRVLRDQQGLPILQARKIQSTPWTQLSPRSIERGTYHATNVPAPVEDTLLNHADNLTGIGWDQIDDQVLYQYIHDDSDMVGMSLEEGMQAMLDPGQVTYVYEDELSTEQEDRLSVDRIQQLEMMGASAQLECCDEFLVSYVPDPGFETQFNLPAWTKVESVVQSRSKYQRILPRTQSRQRDEPFPPDSEMNDVGHTVKKKRRPLDIDSRESTKRLRTQATERKDGLRKEGGPCTRCHALKIRCDFDPDSGMTTCSRCASENKRAYHLPCLQQEPYKLFAHLLTSLTTGHLNLTHFKDYMSPLKQRYNTDRTFLLTIRQDLPQCFKIPVREFDPGQKYITVKTVFPIKHDDEADRYLVEATKILSPPLVPAFDFDSELERKTFYKPFIASMNRMLRDLESETPNRAPPASLDGVYHDWHEIYFPQAYGFDFARSIFGIVCSFHRKVTHGKDPALKTALRTTVFSHMIGHAFCIPSAHINETLSQMKFSHEGQPGQFVCPQFIDRFIKVLLFPYYRILLEKAMSQYEILFSKNKLTQLLRDRILCMSLVLLMIVGEQQVKAVARVQLAAEFRDSYTDKAADSRVAEIEQMMVKRIFDFWSYNFADRKRRLPEADGDDAYPSLRATEFKLDVKLRTQYERHKSELDEIDNELASPIDPKTFSVHNTTRLLKKFVETVLGVEQSTTPSTNTATMTTPASSGIVGTPASSCSEIQ